MLVILYVLYGRSSLKCVAILLGQTKDKGRGQALKSKAFSETIYKTPETRGPHFLISLRRYLAKRRASSLINVSID